jgi:hypothetical protein
MYGRLFICGGALGGCGVGFGGGGLGVCVF